MVNVVRLTRRNMLHVHDSAPILVLATGERPQAARMGRLI
jgi:hypothetical protein